MYKDISELLAAQKRTVKRKINKIVIHHTATASPADVAKAKTLIKNIRQAHLNRGMADIAYHILIYRNMLFKGREIADVGAHALGHNSDSIGVAVIGNADYFNTGAAEELKTLIKTVLGLCSKYGVAPANVYYHKQLNQTLCPCFPDSWTAELKKHFPYIGGQKIG